MSLRTLFRSLFHNSNTSARRGRAANRTVLGVERFEDRTVPAAIGVAGGVMTIEGNGAPDLIVIRDNGDGDLTIFHGRTDDFLGLVVAPAASNVSAIDIRTHGGRDVVLYEQAGDRARNMAIDVRLGDGVDSFTANVVGDINAGRTLDIDVDGGLAGDFITVDATYDVDIETGIDGWLPSGVLRVDLNGGGFFNFGRDTLNVLYEGELDGVLDFAANGEWGDDKLVAEVNVDDGSNGFLAGVLDGSQGEDEVVYHITKDDPTDPLSILYALARGGGGDDRWDITPNVTRRNL
jgi:hypothetical protein